MSIKLLLNFPNSFKPFIIKKSEVSFVTPSYILSET